MGQMGQLGQMGQMGQMGQYKCDNAGVYEDVRMYYSGMLIEGFWKVVREAKLCDGLSLV